MPAGLSETRRLVAPILSRAGIVDQRAYLWTASELEWLALTLGVTPRRDPARRPRLLDLGCGWGSLGIALARRVDDLRVEGVDLDPELLAAGRLIVQALELRDRVHLREDDLTQLDREALVSFDAVTCQAVLVHLPRAESWLSGLVAGLQAGTVVALVEVDALAVMSLPVEGLAVRTSKRARRLGGLRAGSRGGRALHGCAEGHQLHGDEAGEDACQRHGGSPRAGVEYLVH